MNIPDMPPQDFNVQIAVVRTVTQDANSKENTRFALEIIDTVNKSFDVFSKKIPKMKPKQAAASHEMFLIIVEGLKETLKVMNDKKHTAIYKAVEELLDNVESIEVALDVQSDPKVKNYLRKHERALASGKPLATTPWNPETFTW